MAIRSSGKSVFIKWSIENFHMCWHKTGERLESPLFNVDFTSQTSWRIWLYPRGEDDGEYISLFLFREEGGPDEVHVDFKLYFYFGRSIQYHPQQNFSGYSFSMRQKVGLKCFFPRWKIFASRDNQMDQLFHVRCVILNRGTDEFSNSSHDLYTRIRKEGIYGTEICDNVTDLDSNRSKDIEVKPILENESVININLSYFDDSLVIKILPVNCMKIKYSLCKITIIKNWGKESPIEHFRCWIGEIKADIWRYSVFNPETESFKPELKILTDKTFFVHYDFEFSTGEMVTFCGVKEYSRYLMTTNVTFQQCLNANSDKRAPSALKALEKNYRSGSFTDVHNKTETEFYRAHIAILCARCTKFSSIIGESNRIEKMPFFGANIENFLFFMYTDILESLTLETILELHKVGLSVGFDLLTTKCRNILTAYLNSMTAAKMLNGVFSCSDLPLKTAIKNYIATHYESVFSFLNWNEFDKPEIKKEFIFLRYRKQ